MEVNLAQGPNPSPWNNWGFPNCKITMLTTDDAIEYFGDTLDDNQAFIELIYKNTLNKTYEDDPEGIELHGSVSYESRRRYYNA